MRKMFRQELEEYYAKIGKTPEEILASEESAAKNCEDPEQKQFLEVHVKLFRALLDLTEEECGEVLEVLEEIRS